MVTWDIKLSTGDGHTDSQHKVLIDKLNEFEVIVSSNSSGDIRREAGEVLDFLQFYAAWHFAQDEQLMAESVPPKRQRYQKETTTSR